MEKFICTAEVMIEAENQDDAAIELLGKMDAHDIHWEIEEVPIGWEVDEVSIEEDNEG